MKYMPACCNYHFNRHSELETLNWPFMFGLYLGKFHMFLGPVIEEERL